MTEVKKTVWRPTPEQRLAVDYPGNVIVSAGAGSGKTRVLVERYIRLLIDEHPAWPVESVVAITFTRKAAAELKHRISSRLAEELGREDNTAGRRARLGDVRARLSAAPIGTIHNFCSRILRMFAYDVGLNPDFQVIEGAPAYSFRTRAIADQIARIVGDEHDPLRPDLLLLLTLYKRGEVEAMLARMLGGREDYLKAAQRMAETPLEELFEELRQLQEELCGAEAAAFRSKLVEVLQAIGSTSPEAIAKLCNEQVTREAEGLTEWLYDAPVVLLTKAGEPRKKMLDLGLDGACETVAELGRLWSEISKCKSAPLGAVDRQNLAVTQSLARVFLSLAESHRQMRAGFQEDREADLLEYGDLEMLAARLVSEGGLPLKSLRRRINYMILDEFQDTSEVQWRIIAPVVSRDDGTLVPGKLFAVGDQKQGIYGFRQAEVELFRRLQRMVVASNEEWEGSRGAITMSRNFRTRETPLSLVNQVFERVLASGSGDQSVEFEPLLAAEHKTGGETFFLYAKAVAGEAEVDEDGTGAEEGPTSRELEIELVADHIARTVREGVAPEDIAILFRRRAEFGIFERALKDRGLPVSAQSTDGLLAQKEVQDMVAILKLLLWPHNDLAAAQYLRGRFVNCTDNLLLKLGLRKGRGLWQKAVQAAADGHYPLEGKLIALQPAEQERLQFAVQVIDEIAPGVGIAPVAELLENLYEALGARIIVAADPADYQRRAVSNLEELVALAESEGGCDLHGFIDFIESDESAGGEVAQAEESGQAKGVRIMTVHASKGLEFSMVYLPRLSSGIAARSAEVATDKAHWMAVRAPATTETKPYLVEMLRRHQQKRGLAEERRVLYVAMTRCQDRLALSAAEKERATGETFYDLLRDEFDRAGELQATGVEGRDEVVPVASVVGGGRASAPPFDAGEVRRLFSELKKATAGRRGAGAGLPRLPWSAQVSRTDFRKQLMRRWVLEDGADAAGGADGGSRAGRAATAAVAAVQWIREQGVEGARVLPHWEAGRHGVAADVELPGELVMFSSADFDAQLLSGEAELLQSADPARRPVRIVELQLTEPESPGQQSFL